MILDGLDLLQPILADRPCGENLEDTELMAALDAYRLFGLPIAPEPPPPWIEIKARAVEALARSKDLRALAHLSAASLSTDGLAAFLGMLTTASRWLELYWTDVYPRIDEDAVVRRNALTAFADQTAILEPLRRAAMVSSRQHGRFGLRDVEIASGRMPRGDDETAPDERQIDTAFASTPFDELTSLHESVAGAISAVQGIDARMRAVDAAPDLDRLLTQLARMENVLASHLAVHPGRPAPPAGARAGAGPGGSGTVAIGGIASRQDAIRAMAAVAEYFRQTEPSSPVPMLLDRATRLVSKTFLEVLEDLAPDGVVQARTAGGIRNDQ